MKKNEIPFSSSPFQEIQKSFASTCAAASIITTIVTSTAVSLSSPLPSHAATLSPEDAFRLDANIPALTESLKQRDNQQIIKNAYGNIRQAISPLNQVDFSNLKLTLPQDIKGAVKDILLGEERIIINGQPFDIFIESTKGSFLVEISNPQFKKIPLLQRDVAPGVLVEKVATKKDDTLRETTGEATEEATTTTTTATTTTTTTTATTKKSISSEFIPMTSTVKDSQSFAIDIQPYSLLKSSIIQQSNRALLQQVAKDVQSATSPAIDVVRPSIQVSLPSNKIGAIKDLLSGEAEFIFNGEPVDIEIESDEGVFFVKVSCPVLPRVPFLMTTSQLQQQLQPSTSFVRDFPPVLMTETIGEELNIEFVKEHPLVTILGVIVASIAALYGKY